MSFDFGALWDVILLKTLNINLGNLFGTGESSSLIPVLFSMQNKIEGHNDRNLTFVEIQ